MKKLIIISALLSTAFLAGCGTTSSAQPKQQPTDQLPQAVACTMEAKECPDGSYVGRTGPNCEFAACPISGEETACGITPDASCGTGK